MEENYSVQRERFMQQESRYHSEKAEWDRKKSRIDQDIGALDSKRKAYRDKHNGLVRLKERIAGWKSKVTEAKRRGDELLARIEVHVGLRVDGQ
jgi:hypothetical protein